MGALSSLKEALARPSSFASLVDNPFLHFDVPAVARELHLEQRGTENGQKNLPAANARSFDAAEEEIVDRVGHAWREAQQEATRWFQASDERISNTSLLSQLPTMQTAAIQAESAIKAGVSQATLRLTTARDAVSQSYKQLRAFQCEHNLHRPAKLAASSVLTYGTILLTWVGETAANSVLLRENDDLGLIGGIFAAAIVGVINIGVAVFAGRMILPRLNMRASSRPLFLAGAVIWALFLLIWNLFAAHYRDAKVAGAAGPEFVALDMMSSMPASIYSWGLLILGIIFAVMAASAAYRLSDPYPGYADVWNEHEQRCADYAGEVESASADLKDMHDDASEEITDIRRGLAQQVADQDRALGGRNAFAQRLAQYHGELERAGRRLLTIYRDSNRVCRSEPPPPHFDEAFSLPPPAIPAAPRAAVTHADVERGSSILETAQRSVSDAYLAGVQSFETLESLKARLPE